MSNVNSRSIDPFGIIDGLAPADSQQEPSSEEDNDLASRIEYLFEMATAAEATRLMNENLYLAATYGDQYLAVDPNTNEVYRIINDDQSAYAAQNNQMILAQLAFWGKLTKPQPDFQVNPGDGSLEEVQGARAAERFIDYFRTARNGKDIVDGAKYDAGWSFKGGCVELTWDPQGGSYFHHCFTCGYSTDADLDADSVPCPYCEQQQQQYQQQVMQFQQQVAQPQMPSNAGPNPQQAPQGGMQPAQPGQPPGMQQSMRPGLPPGGMAHPGPQMVPPTPPPPPGELTKVNRGGPQWSYLDPRTVRFISAPGRIENCRAYIVREPYPVQMIRGWFPEFAGKIHPEQDVYPTHGAQWTVYGSTGVKYNENLQDHAYLFRVVEMPTGVYPRGRIIFMCNKRILAMREGYFDYFGRLPLFRFGWIPERGTPYFRPPAADAIFRQRSLNRLETQAEEHTSLSSKPKTIIPYGSRLAIDELNSQSDQILMPTIGTANMIRYLEPPQLSPDVYTRRGMAINDIRQFYAVTVSETNSASADASGRNLALTEAESDQTTGPIIRAHNREEADLCRCTLILAQLFGDPEEKFWALGDDNQEFYTFQDLMFRAKHSNVSIQATDGLSSNPTARRAEALSMAQQGIFNVNGSFDMAAYTSAAGIKVKGLVPDSSDSEVQAAVASIKLMELGQTWEPAPFDDAQTFMKVYMQWLRSNGRRMKDKNPQALQRVTQAFGYYQNMLFQAQMAQQGAPGAPGGPGQPDQASPATGTQSAPGGTPNATPASQEPGSSSSAAALTHQADQHGEQAVRAGLPHEG